MNSKQKLKIEMNFCLNTWLAKLVRLSLNKEALELYAQEVYHNLLNDGVDKVQAESIKTFILTYSN